MANDQAPGLPAPPTPTLPESKGEALQSGFAQFLKAGTANSTKARISKLQLKSIMTSAWKKRA
jgi:hypothetical protein